MLIGIEQEYRFGLYIYRQVHANYVEQNVRSVDMVLLPKIIVKRCIILSNVMQTF